METLAGLSIPSGGTIHDFDELKDFLGVAKSENDKVGLTLKKFGFLCAGHYVDPDQNDSANSTLAENGIEEDRKLTKIFNFNLYLGFNDDIMDINRECILVIETVKAFRRLVSLTDVATCHSTVFKILNSKGHVKTDQLLKMMDCVRKAKSFTIITNEAPYRIPTNSPYHPLNKNGYHYNNPTGENIISSCYIHNTNPLTSSTEDSNNWFSWFDLSQQLFADACLLKVLTMRHCFGGENGMSIKNPTVQDAVDRMLLGLSSLVQLNEKLSEEDLKVLEDYYNKPDEIDSSNDSGNVNANGEDNKQLMQSGTDIKDEESSIPTTQTKTTWGSENNIDQESIKGTDESSDNENDVDSHKTTTEDNLKIPKESQLATMAQNHTPITETGTSTISVTEPVQSPSKTQASPKDANSRSSTPNLIPKIRSSTLYNQSSNRCKMTLNFDKYLYYQFDNRLVMVQWPLMICGLCCIQPKQKLIIDCCFNALISFGVGSGEISLLKLQRLWDLQRSGVFDFDKDDVFADEDDAVPFS
ncbi:unnamed protein product [Ambrosiozyma monospora]|uniref:Unnamed protein product n=1 Tax=Ambrosiozyma monospora TaxID=43982 RepID=A0A9W6Z0G4_AMBMO|nr:unnamed protein product [Ambrosiozyma monospora]